LSISSARSALHLTFLPVTRRVRRVPLPSLPFQPRHEPMSCQENSAPFSCRQEKFCTRASLFPAGRKPGGVRQLSAGRRAIPPSGLRQGPRGSPKGNNVISRPDEVNRDGQVAARYSTPSGSNIRPPRFPRVSPVANDIRPLRGRHAASTLTEP